MSDSRGKVPINVYIGNNCSSDATPSIIFARQPFFIFIDVDIKKYESIVVGPNSPEMDTYLEIFFKGPSISKPGLVQLDDQIGIVFVCGSFLVRFIVESGDLVTLDRL